MHITGVAGMERMVYKWKSRNWPVKQEVNTIRRCF